MIYTIMKNYTSEYLTKVTFKVIFMTLWEPYRCVLQWDVFKVCLAVKGAYFNDHIQYTPNYNHKESNFCIVPKTSQPLYLG